MKKIKNLNVAVLPQPKVGERMILVCEDGLQLKTSPFVSSTWDNATHRMTVETKHTIYRLINKTVTHVAGIMVAEKGLPAQVLIDGTWYTTSPVLEYLKRDGGFIETRTHIYQM